MVVRACQRIPALVGVSGLALADRGLEQCRWNPVIGGDGPCDVDHD
jgi:hypothetical protein